MNKSDCLIEALRLLGFNEVTFGGNRYRKFISEDVAWAYLVGPRVPCVGAVRLPCNAAGF